MIATLPSFKPPPLAHLASFLLRNSNNNWHAFNIPYIGDVLNLLQDDEI
jgi:hypothetical protein